MDLAHRRLTPVFTSMCFVVEAWIASAVIYARTILGLFVFFPRVFLSSRVPGACPVTTDFIMRVDVRTTTYVSNNLIWTSVLLFRPGVFSRGLSRWARRRPPCTHASSLCPGRGPWWGSLSRILASNCGICFRRARVCQDNANPTRFEMTIRMVLSASGRCGCVICPKTVSIDVYYVVATEQHRSHIKPLPVVTVTGRFICLCVRVVFLIHLGSRNWDILHVISGGAGQNEHTITHFLRSSKATEQPR